MRKSDKKLDNKLRVELTEVCESVLKQIKGFLWLTHIVDYDDFPSSLKVICVFDRNDNLNACLSGQQGKMLNKQIMTGLVKSGVNIKKIDKHVGYESQENCDHYYAGNWADCFKRVIH